MDRPESSLTECKLYSVILENTALPAVAIRDGEAQIHLSLETGVELTLKMNEELFNLLYGMMGLEKRRMTSRRVGAKKRDLKKIKELDKKHVR